MCLKFISNMEEKFNVISYKSNKSTQIMNQFFSLATRTVFSH